MAAANPDVLAFYRELPFNYRESAREHAAQVRAVDQIARYPVLPPLLRKGCSVLDVGCGAGWFSLSAAYHYRAAVTGIDFNEVATARAREVANALRVAARFETADLFRWESSTPFDVVVSLGVLHHTNDCLAALRRCAQHVRPGGHLFVGLYHRYGRRPFLEHFRRLQAAGAGEAELLEHYRRLHASLTDEVHLRSWFRDQVLHPHETQHTLREIVPLLQDCGLSLVSTSLNGFARLGDIEALLAAEPGLETIGAERLARGEYYPGFFLFLARKTAG
jgi:SAM-dependent methyltransferase